MQYISVNEYKFGKLKHKIYLQKSGGSMPLYFIRHVVSDAVKATLYNEAVDKICVVNVLVTNDKGIQKYNDEYRNINSATDVLSFPMQTFRQPGWSGCRNPEPDNDTGYIPLGDIVASSETIQKHSDEYGNRVLYEWTYIIIHSTLHLLGYDHDTEENERVMHEKCGYIIQKLGIPKEN